MPSNKVTVDSLPADRPASGRLRPPQATDPNKLQTAAVITIVSALRMLTRDAPSGADLDLTSRNTLGELIDADLVPFHKKRGSAMLSAGDAALQRWC